MTVIPQREYWWNRGEAQAVAIYRAKVMVPALILTAAIVLPLFVFSDMKQPGAGAFIVGVWFVFMLPVLIRRRRAAIFTSDSFLFRPALGRLIRVPLNGIERASIIEPEPGEEYYVPTVRIELLVGGQMTVRLGVAKPEEITRRLNDSGGRGSLSMPPNKTLQPPSHARR